MCSQRINELRSGLDVLVFGVDMELYEENPLEGNQVTLDADLRRT